MTMIFPPSTFTSTCGGRVRVSVAFGPLTSIEPAFTVLVTPFGSAMGFLPVRDCLMLPGLEWAACVAACMVMASPNLADELTAHALTARLTVGHDATAPAGAREPHPPTHAPESGAGHGDAPPRGRPAPRALDG